MKENELEILRALAVDSEGEEQVILPELLEEAATLPNGKSFHELDQKIRDLVGSENPSKDLKFEDKPRAYNVERHHGRIEFFKKVQLKAR